MKILVTPTSFLNDENIIAREKLESFADEVIYNKLGRPLDENEVAEQIIGVDGYIAGLDYITEKTLEIAAPKLKVISRYGAGVDRVDIQAATRLNIIVTNTPSTNSTAVAELAMGLIFCAARNIPNLNNGVKAGQWIRYKGTQLYGKTLGIVGFGAVGQELARCAVGIGMKTLVYDPFYNNNKGNELGVEERKLEELFSEADIISLHMPLNETTNHLINKTAINKMKSGVIIINTSRGGIIDEQDVYDAVTSGKIKYIGLDTFETEPPIDSPLLTLEHAVFTPHSGAHTSEAVASMGMMAIDNLISVLTTGKSVNEVS